MEAFAELGPFFDRPVRTFSSGMFLRLAFACAAAEEPEVMVIDEVLAVGDARFQRKCYRRIEELRRGGTTILLVTHVMHALTAVCDRALVLDHGRLVFDGDPSRGVDRYYQLFFTAPEIAAGGPSDATRNLALDMYIRGFQGNQMGLASAIATILVIIGLALALFLRRIGGSGSQLEGA